MKRIEYGGQSLVTGTAVADAITHYVTRASGMDAAVAVDIPVLKDNGLVERQTILLSKATQLHIVDIDGVATDEAERFPVPALPPVGGEAIPWTIEEMKRDAPVIDEDPLDPFAYEP